MVESGQVSLDMQRVTLQQVTIDFVDNGHGISREERELIFEKFSRMNDPAHAGSAGF